MQKVQGWAEQGGSQVSTSGVPSTTRVEKSFPGCIVSVYEAGTQTLASLFSDDGVTVKSNPFLADNNALWWFYAESGTYDIRFSGTGISVPFTLTAVPVGADTGGDEVDFTVEIPFANNYTQVASHTMVADLTLIPDTTNQVLGAVTALRLTGDGASDIDITAFKIHSGSAPFIITADILNVLLFYYDGTDHWVNIYQEISIPVIEDAAVEDADPDVIVATYNQTLDASSVPAPSAFSPSGGRTATNVDIVGTTVEITVDTPYASTDVITYDYTAGASPIQSSVGGAAANLVDQAVTNNIAPVEVAIVPDSLVNMTESPSGTWVAGVVTPWNSYAQCLQYLPALASGSISMEPSIVVGGGSMLGFMSTNIPGNYTTINCGAYVFGGFFYYIDSGTAVSTSVAYLPGDLIIIRREAGIVTAYRDRSAVETVVKVFSGTRNSDFFVKFNLEIVGDSFTLPKGFGVIDI